MLRDENEHNGEKIDKVKITNNGPSGPMGKGGLSHKESWADGTRGSSTGVKKAQSLKFKFKKEIIGYRAMHNNP